MNRLSVERRKHSEFAAYQLTARQALPFVNAVANWRRTGDVLIVEKYGLNWTLEKAEHFFRRVSAMLVEYNRVVWDDFNYCKVCKGQCCVRGAPSVDETDFLALACLGEAVPDLPENDATDEQRCIYLRGHFCSWPDAWRTFGCWTFYCLGPPPVYESLANGRQLGDMYAELARALEQVITNGMPAELRAYEQVHRVRLADGVGGASGFAWEMLKAMESILVHPFCEQYGLIRARSAE